MPRNQPSDDRIIEELQEQIEQLNARLVQQGPMLKELREARPARDNAVCIDRAARVPVIPELIKLTPTFDGTPSALVSFIDSVERKILASEANFSEDELAIHRPIWVGLIRDKIVGKANDILVDQTPLVWDEIKSALKKIGRQKGSHNYLSECVPFSTGTKIIKRLLYEV